MRRNKDTLFALSSMLCAGLPTPHLADRQVSRIRQIGGRRFRQGRETCAERGAMRHNNDTLFAFSSCYPKNDRINSQTDEPR